VLHFAISDADRLDTVVDPVKRHSLPPLFAFRNAGESLRKCSEAQIVTEPKAVISQSLA
jgi:Na+/H+ antiporter NhaA